MSDLRDYILSKLYEMAKAPKKKVEPKEPVKKEPVKTEPSDEDQEDFARWQDEHNPMSNVQQESTDLRSYILNKASETLLEFDYRAVMATISKGVTGQGSADGWDKPKPQAPVKPKKRKHVGPKKPPVTEELKAKIAHILADKIDEIIIDRKNEKMVNPFKEPAPKINDPKFDASEYLPKPKSSPGSKPKPNPKDLLVPFKANLYRGKK